MFKKLPQKVTVKDLSRLKCLQDLHSNSEVLQDSPSANAGRLTHFAPGNGLFNRINSLT
jgi:hypothetical protein